MPGNVGSSSHFSRSSRCIFVENLIYKCFSELPLLDFFRCLAVRMGPGLNYTVCRVSVFFYGLGNDR